jgi:CRISPR-associated protein (TIGR02710 family)
MCKAMIISVGGTPAPIIKSVCQYTPEFVSFFASQDTSDLVKSIKDEAGKRGIKFKSQLTLVDDVNDLLHCHGKAEDAVKRVIARGYEKSEVIVDYTGGTKNMSVALALGAISNGFSFSYVGGDERTKEGIGIVSDGHEQIYPSVNPWDFLAVDERKKIALLFNQYQFKAAKNLIDGLLEKSTKSKPLFKKMGFMIDGYYKWDLFRHRESLDLFKRANIKDLVEDEDTHIRKFAKETDANLIFLENIIEKGKDGKKPCLEYTLDIYANSERRFEEGKTDDAILRIYRIVEMAAQIKLSDIYGISTSDVKKDIIPEPLRENFIKEYKSQRDGRIKISQTASFTLLAELGDKLGKVFQEKKSGFLDIQSSRNYSYLAHGFEPSKDKTYLSLKEFIQGLQLFNNEDAPVFPRMEL